MDHGLVRRGDVFRQIQKRDDTFVVIRSFERDALSTPIARAIVDRFYFGVQRRSIVGIESLIDAEDGIGNRLGVAVVDTLKT